MVSFNGEIREYPGLVVDQFGTHTHTKGRAFFLSHAHSDHMKGIQSQKFAEIILLSRVKLFATEITKLILSTDGDMQLLMAHIEIITVNCTLSVELWEGMEVQVTPLQTGHCPGAVMFLFEGTNGTVLYTGDFRLNLEDLRETRLYRDESELIQINTLYLDTTFCHMAADSFITRDTSREIILEKTADWLENKENTVCLNFPCLGYEHIIMELSTQLCMKLNVTGTKLSHQYDTIPCVRECVTHDKSRIRIVSCNESNDSKCLAIKPSAQWFVSNGKVKSKCEYIEPLNLWRIQHSNHCSYRELIEFVKKLTPDRIVPIVTPVLSASPLDAIDRLKHLLRPPKLELKLCQQQQQQQQQLERQVNKKIKPNRIKRLMSSLINETEDTQLQPVCKKRHQTES